MLGAVDFRQGVDTAWTHIATFIPKFVGFLLIVLIGYFVAKAVAKVLARILHRVGFDRVVEKGGFRPMLAKSRLEPSDILGKIVFWAFFLLVLQLAFGIFGPNPISDLLRGIIAFLPNVFVAVVILVIAGALAKVATELLEAVLGRVSGGQWIARGAGMVILGIGFFAALDQLHIAPAIVNGLFYATLAVIVGSAVIAIGVGGIPTMRRYWERSVTALESKGAEIKQEMQSQDTPRILKERAQEVTGAGARQPERPS
jgi:mechanosensitive ion channel-like protein